MTTFDELRESWQSQPVMPPEDIVAMQERLQKKSKAQQRGVFWANVGTTVGFVGVFCTFGWVYVSFREGRSLFFGGSLLFMSLLMMVYLFVIWKGISFRNMNMNLGGNEFIEEYLRRLHWRRKTITFYGWVYSILLWLALMCYYYDVLAGGSLRLKIMAPVITTLYIFGLQLIVKRTSRKKQLKKLDGLIEDLKGIVGIAAGLVEVGRSTE